MCANYYSEAIRILCYEKLNHKQVVVELARKHPKTFCELASEVLGGTAKTNWQQLVAKAEKLQALSTKTQKSRKRKGGVS